MKTDITVTEYRSFPEIPRLPFPTCMFRDIHNRSVGGVEIGSVSHVLGRHVSTTAQIPPKNTATRTGGGGETITCLTW